MQKVLSAITLVSTLASFPQPSFAGELKHFEPKIDCKISLMLANKEAIQNGMFSAINTDRSYTLEKPESWGGYLIKDKVNFNDRYSADFNIQFAENNSTIYSAQNTLVTDFRDNSERDGSLRLFVRLLETVDGKTSVIAKNVKDSDTYSMPGDASLRALSVAVLNVANNPAVDTFLLPYPDMELKEALETGVVPDNTAHHVHALCRIDRTEIIRPQ